MIRFSDGHIVCGYHVNAGNWSLADCTWHREVAISWYNLDITILAHDGSERVEYMISRKHFITGLWEDIKQVPHNLSMTNQDKKNSETSTIKNLSDNHQLLALIIQLVRNVGKFQITCRFCRKDVAKEMCCSLRSYEPEGNTISIRGLGYNYSSPY